MEIEWTDKLFFIEYIISICKYIEYDERLSETRIVKKILIIIRNLFHLIFQQADAERTMDELCS